MIVHCDSSLKPKKHRNSKVYVIFSFWGTTIANGFCFYPCEEIQENTVSYMKLIFCLNIWHVWTLEIKLFLATFLLVHLCVCALMCLFVKYWAWSLLNKYWMKLSCLLGWKQHFQHLRNYRTIYFKTFFCDNLNSFSLKYCMAFFVCLFK